MKIEQMDNGKWTLEIGGYLIGVYESNREAWRAADEANGEPLSRAESVTEWVSRRLAAEKG